MKKASIKTYLNIGGERYEVAKNTYKISFNYFSSIKYNSNLKTLSQCYGRPSEIKVSIYNDYYDTLKKECEEVFDYGISSYNANLIILGAYVKLYNDSNIYYLDIHKTYNKAYKVELVGA